MHDPPCIESQSHRGEATHSPTRSRGKASLLSPIGASEAREVSVPAKEHQQKACRGKKLRPKYFQSVFRGTGSMFLRYAEN